MTQFKQPLVLFSCLLTVILTFSACKKDKDKVKDDQYEQLVTGSWYHESQNGVALTPCEKKSKATFGTNGVLTTEVYFAGSGSCSSPNTELTGTYTVDGNKLTIKLNGQTSTGTYSIKNGVLTTTLTNAGDTDVDTYDRNPG